MVDLRPLTPPLLFSYKSNETRTHLTEEHVSSVSNVYYCRAGSGKPQQCFRAELTWLGLEAVLCSAD